MLNIRGWLAAAGGAAPGWHALCVGPLPGLLGQDEFSLARLSQGIGFTVVIDQHELAIAKQRPAVDACLFR